MKRTLILALLAVTILAVSAPSVSMAAYPQPAVKFSSIGIDLVRTQASNFSSSAGLWPDELAAMMLAVTWGETQGDNAWDTPSPQTMGRSDTSPALYANWSPGVVEQRDFFHAGVGAWQIDSSLNDPNFAWLTAADAIDLNIAAREVAQVMASRWNAFSGYSDPAERRDKVWEKWFACTDNYPDCEDRFDLIYNDTTHQLNIGVSSGLVRDSNVGQLGGATWSTCRYNGDPTYFSCLQVNPATAQGNKAYQGPGFPVPLTKTFYVFDDGGYEWRTWKSYSSPAYSIDWNATRPLGRDVRTDVDWFSGLVVCNGACR